MVMLIVACLVAVAVGLLLIPWVGLLGLIPLALGVLVLVWGALAFVSGASPVRAVRRTRSTDLLGPGGPDDPESDGGRPTETPASRPSDRRGR